ncbi:MAG: hypothetical protein M0R17_04005 [Candidatus Omnitrophica bacterium]|jgi:hypothetical protein|nr:hypothetical protein [Candidatus Omnitrophota bacterium]
MKNIKFNLIVGIVTVTSIVVSKLLIDRRKKYGMAFNSLDIKILDALPEMISFYEKIGDSKSVHIFESLKESLRSGGTLKNDSKLVEAFLAEFEDIKKLNKQLI